MDRSRIILPFLLVLTFFSIVNAQIDKPQVCFYYHDNPPDEMYKFCDWLVVDPTNSKVYKKNSKAELIAYISIGEIRKNDTRRKEIKDKWVIGENKAWGTEVLDIRNPEYQDYLIHKVFSKYANRYDGFFFDTVDSYMLALKSENERAEYRKAFVEFIKKVKKWYPYEKIILNRGFEVFDDVKGYIDAVAVESLFQGLDLKNGGYAPVPQMARDWLLPILNKIKDNDVYVIVIDYLPPQERKKALETAQKIAKLGFIPYITNREVNIIGTSFTQLQPRRVLILYDSVSCPVVMECASHYMASLVYEYYGYVPEMADINTELPDINQILIDRYKAIIAWIERPTVNNYRKFHKWIVSKIKEGNKVVFVDSFGFPMSEEFLKPLGIEVKPVKSGKNVKIAYRHESIGFEVEPFVDFDNVAIIPKDGKPLLILEDDKGEKTVPAAITKWGGYALYGASTYTKFKITAWVVNPFYFFKEATNIKNYPMPDVTTENGRRRLFAHIDGDGFIQPLDFNPKRFSSEEIRDSFLKKYPVPHAVSIIEGEIAPWGAYPKLPHKKLENIARSIFRLKNVELASHSFSHPFKWQYVYNAGKTKKGWNLPIPGYTKFSLEREILGSVGYINEYLAPKNKRTKIFLWTGDCNPPWQALKLTYDNGLLNMNGGDTGISKKEPFLSLVAPMGINKKGYYQVYAPFQNENYYTNEWHGPYYGFQNVIQAYEMTDYPRRFKPIDIYYHFYIASKYASWQSLKKVFDWAMKQKTTPIFPSEYIESVLDYRKLVISTDGCGYKIKGDGKLKELKYFGKIYPRLEYSKGITGYFYDKRLNLTYIHLDGTGDYYLVIDENKGKKVPYLEEFNGIVIGYNIDKDKGKYTYKLKSYVPAKIRFADTKSCHINIIDRKDYKIERKGDRINLRFKKDGVVKVEFICKQ
jgi:hypothetical protein